MNKKIEILARLFSYERIVGTSFSSCFIKGYKIKNGEMMREFFKIGEIEWKVMSRLEMIKMKNLLR